MTMDVSSYVGVVKYTKNGKDAAFYEVVPSTHVVSLDSGGNWVEGTKVDSRGNALVDCEFYKCVGNVRSKLTGEFFVVYGTSQVYSPSAFSVPISKDSSSVSVDLYESVKKIVSGTNMTTAVRGQFLARTTISVNKAGDDAVAYEIVPLTNTTVSIDSDGNWVQEEGGARIDDYGYALVKLKAVKIVGGKREDWKDGQWRSYSTLEFPSNDRSCVEVSVSDDDSSVSVSLCERVRGANGAFVAGETLAQISIIVNRAGTNGQSISAQFSKDGSTSWHDGYQAGDKYIRIFSNGVWSAAIKIVGDDGTSFLIKGSLSSKEGLPTSGAVLGDAYLIDGDLWVYVAYTGTDTEKHFRGFENIGNIKGPKGDSVTIVSTSVAYAIHDKGNEASGITNWQSVIPTVTAEKPYLWTRTIVIYSDGNQTASYSVATRGNRGAVFRQHTGFETPPYSYQSGSGVEEFIDIIRSGKTWYRCIKSYTSESNDARDNVGSGCWSSSGVSNMPFIATSLLLAENATIDMVGTNEINLYDSGTMFGSLRVPHEWDNDRDMGEYALWLGSEKGFSAPFSVTKNGEMSSTKGTIGGFRINEDYIGSKENFDMCLTNRFIHFGNFGGILNNDGYIIELGDNDNGRDTGYKGGIGLDIWSIAGGKNNNMNIGARINVSVNTPITDGYSAALQIGTGWYEGAGEYDVNNAKKGNHAIMIEGGDVVGLRPSYVRIDSNMELTEYNHTIECCNTGKIQLKLPGSPLYGQHYIIIQRYGQVTLYSSTKSIVDINDNDKVYKSWYSNTKNQVSWLWYNGSEWLVKYFIKN